MNDIFQTSTRHLHKLCQEITDRSVGSLGNQSASRYFEQELFSLGWDIETQEFEAMDWIDGGASLRCGEVNFQVFVSPYSIGCDIEAQMIPVASLEELEQAKIAGKIVLLHSKIAREQLMPKNYVFYNPIEHQRIIALLEQGTPKAIISATGRNAALAGGVYPFPLIEDGDFEIPSVYMTEEEGKRLLPYTRAMVSLKSSSRRVKSAGYNVIGRKGSPSGRRLVVTAHIDAKKGTPGAIDNATGVAILLLLAELLKDYAGNKQVEIVALNGEDYYAAPGQMVYLHQMQGRFSEIMLNINIDGAGYHKGKSAFSFYGLSDENKKAIKNVLVNFDGIMEGVPWVQGDHTMFIQNGCPAIAVSSQWFTDNIDNQEITHTSKDDLDIVDNRHLVEIAQALSLLIEAL